MKAVKGGSVERETKGKRGHNKEIKGSRKTEVGLKVQMESKFWKRVKCQLF